MTICVGSAERGRRGSFQAQAARRCVGEAHRHSLQGKEVTYLWLVMRCSGHVDIQSVPIARRKRWEELETSELNFCKEPSQGEQMTLDQKKKNRA